MTKITVTIDTKSNARLFLEMLNALSFVKKIQSEVVYGDSLNKEEIKILEERWEGYLKNPKAVSTWKSVKAELQKKYAG